MSVDPERRLLWERQILGYLDELYGASNFSLLVSNQLVGTTLSVYVDSATMARIRNVEISTKKTGMGGIAGNKGSVAVRLDFCDTSICFLSSHLAAGYSYDAYFKLSPIGQANLQDRDHDYQIVASELCFSKGCDIGSHDLILWMGDFNYRLEMDGEEARQRIIAKEFEYLRQFDQLTSRMSIGATFCGFKEAPIAFAPTYKYDPGTNVYDTSEKMRVPSWTDRILFKGSSMENLFYDRAEVDISDHKPVKGLFGAEIVAIDREFRKQVRSELYAAFAASYVDSEQSADAAEIISIKSLSDALSSDDLYNNTEPPPLPPRTYKSLKPRGASKASLTADLLSLDRAPPLPPRPSPKRSYK